MTTTPHGQVPEALRAAPDTSYSPEDRAFHQFWYGHMLEDLMQPPLIGISHSTARYIWDSALRTQQPASHTPPAEQPQPHYSHLHDADAVHGKRLSVYSKPPAEQQSQPGAVYVELPAPNLPRGGFPDLFTEGQMRDFADRTHALRMEQATKETSGGFHVWRDISTAPKDGSRFVATGHNYGLYSEGRHACVAQWFRGSWIEASEWNEASELKYLTHWMPLPSPPDDVAAPAEQQAAPKAAPREPDPADIIAGALQISRGHAIEMMREALEAAPQQEAQEPVFCSYCGGNDETPQEHCTDCLRPVPTKDRIREIFIANGFTIKEGQADLKQYVYDAAYALLSEAPQPAPAPLSDDAKDAARYRWLRENWFTMTSSYQRCITFKVGEPRWSDITEEELDAAIDAALAAQGGK